jgi:hypothetical protein
MATKEKYSMLRNTAFSVALALAVVASGCSIPGLKSGPAPLGPEAFASGDTFAQLPAGDMLMTMDVGTLVNTTIPSWLEKAPSQKKEFEAGMKEMQEKSGIDPKQLKNVALSLKYPQGSGDPTFAAVMTGSYDTTKLAESLKKSDEPGATVTTEDYSGTTIYVRKKGSEEVGVAILDSTAVVAGMPVAQVKATIDARAGKGTNAKSDTDLFDAFKNTNAKAVARFAAKLPKEELQKEMGSNPEAADFLKVKVVSGAIDTSNGLLLDLIGRAGTDAEAKAIHEKLTELLDQGKQAMGQNDMAALLDTIKITVAAADVKISMNLSQADLNKAIEQMGGGAPGGGMSSGMDEGGETGEEGDEEEAVSALRSIGSAEAAYYGQGKAYGSLDDLANANLVDDRIHDGAIVGGYRIQEINVTDTAFEFSAEPVGGSGRAFNITEDLVIRYQSGPMAPRGTSGSPLGG